MRRIPWQLFALIVLLLLSVFCLLFLSNVRSTLTSVSEKYNTIDAELAYEIMLSGRAIFIDNRPKPQYLRERIPGAVNMTYRSRGSEENDMARHLIESFILDDKELVFYCNGGLRTKEALEKIAEWGLDLSNIYWFSGGLPEWKARGFPVEN